MQGDAARHKGENEETKETTAQGSVAVMSQQRLLDVVMDVLGFVNAPSLPIDLERPPPSTLPNQVRAGSDKSSRPHRLSGRRHCPALRQI